MDTLFDILNSRQCKGDRPARMALSANSPNLNALSEWKEWASKLKFVDARTQSGIKCH